MPGNVVQSGWRGRREGERLRTSLPRETVLLQCLPRPPRSRGLGLSVTAGGRSPGGRGGETPPPSFSGDRQTAPSVSNSVSDGAPFPSGPLGREDAPHDLRQSKAAVSVRGPLGGLTSTLPRLPESRECTFLRTAAVRLASQCPGEAGRTGNRGRARLPELKAPEGKRAPHALCKPPLHASPEPGGRFWSRSRTAAAAL